MADDTAGHTDAPEDAFALVGNEIRAEILRTFGDARVEQGETPVLSFSEVRERTDVDVPSSQFNYHLQQLAGHFLERTEEGYRMRPEGRLLYQTLRAGTFTRREGTTTVDAEFDCYYCEAAVEAMFAEGTARVQCPECDYLYDIAAAPPGGFADGDPDLDRVAAYTHHQHLAFARGVCSTCASEVTTELLTPDEVSFPGADRHEVYVYRSCPHCGDQRYLSVGEALLDDPALVAFCHDHGVDVLATPLWELEFAATDRHVTVEDTDPWRVSLRVPFEDETLTLVVDGSLDVLERTRD